MATRIFLGLSALVWIGYGTVIGLLAKAVMPGRDPGGTLATLAMGIAGVVIGCGVATLFMKGKTITPISPPGLCFGTCGAFIILLFYRILGGAWLEKQKSPSPTLQMGNQIGKQLAS